MEGKVELVMVWACREGLTQRTFLLIQGRKRDKRGGFRFLLPTSRQEPPCQKKRGKGKMLLSRKWENCQKDTKFHIKKTCQKEKGKIKMLLSRKLPKYKQIPHVINAAAETPTSVSNLQPMILRRLCEISSMSTDDIPFLQWIFWCWRTWFDILFTNQITVYTQHK